MNDTEQRLAEDLIARLTGPLHLRLMLQPTMALIFAIRDGIEPGHREELLAGGFKETTLLIMAAVLGTIYRVIATNRFYPYLLLRGPASRIATWWKAGHQPRQAGYGTSR
jgi:hypothetical protein